jgi:hypothetical protein
MLLVSLLTVAALATIVCAIVAVVFQLSCRSLEKHIGGSRPDVLEEKTAFRAWLERRWDLNRYRLRVVLAGMGAYALCMLCITWALVLQHDAGQVTATPYVYMTVTTACLLWISLRASIHNSRRSELDTRQIERSAFSF